MIIKAEVRDVFSGELISRHQMVGMNGICFDVPITTRRININWENGSEGTALPALIEKYRHAAESAAVWEGNCHQLYLDIANELEELLTDGTGHIGSGNAGAGNANVAHSNDAGND